MSNTRQQAERARKAYLQLSTRVDRTKVLRDLAVALDNRADEVFSENQKDLKAAEGNIAQPLYKRLLLNEAKLRDVIEGIQQIAAMEDPVGKVVQVTELDDGLVLKKVQTPIGVFTAIFESRPDVVPQIASLAIRTGNAALLKGGREAAFTNVALGTIIHDVLADHQVADAIQLISTREEVGELLEMDDLISLVIPRGS